MKNIMKNLIAVVLASFLFTTVGCERISWKVYNYQTKERCKSDFSEYKAEECYQNRMRWFEANGTRIDSDHKKIPFERKYPG